MSQNLEMVRAVYSGISQRQVAKSYKISRNTLALLLAHSKRCGWTCLEDLASLDEQAFSDELDCQTAPEPNGKYRMPDYEYVHRELARPHVTLKLLWEEYVTTCKQANKLYYMETNFRKYYHQFARIHKATIRLEYKPGYVAEVDWAGSKISFFDEDENNFVKAHVFICCLPCSGLFYAEAFRDEKLASWITGHVHAFTYFGGVCKTLTPDNLRTGIQNSDRYEPVINRTYQELAEYYGSVVLPARVRKSNDKASVENAVRQASRRIIATLRNVQILSFQDLQERVADALAAIVHKRNEQTGESLWDAYVEEEKPYMLPLPATPYVLASWKDAVVQFDCHLAFDKHFYSAPYQYLGEILQVRATNTSVELFYHGEAVAKHKRLWAKKKHSTEEEHMPPNKLFYSSLDAGKLSAMAKKIGPYTHEICTQILENCVIVEQGYKSVLGLINLQKKHAPERMESVCLYVLNAKTKPSYSLVKTVLEKGLDESPEPTTLKAEPLANGFRRGAQYWEEKS